MHNPAVGWEEEEEKEEGKLSRFMGNCSICANGRKRGRRREVWRSCLRRMKKEEEEKEGALGTCHCGGRKRGEEFGEGDGRGQEGEGRKRNLCEKNAGSRLMMRKECGGGNCK